MKDNILEYFQVDAFSKQPFAGNPASVIPLDRWLPDDLLQKIAAQMNLSETAYFIPMEENLYGLRWFTPTKEVELCGHATVASALVIREFMKNHERLGFETLSGVLGVDYFNGRYELDLPIARQQPAPGLVATYSEIFGEKVLHAFRGTYNDMVVFSHEDQIRKLDIKSFNINELNRNVIVTASGKTCDFVSRYFAPCSGIPEDPVTGSTHCQLTPYWAEVLHKDKLYARQLSMRGGELWCRVEGERVFVSGNAVCVMRGNLYLPGSSHD